MEEQSQHPSEKSAPVTGEAAPDFALPDETGRTRTLVDELLLGKPVVLVFMRGEW